MHIRITFRELVNLISAEVNDNMANKKTTAGTNAEDVKKQNQQSSQAQPGQYGTEFSEETDAQKVKQQNKKSQQKK